MKISMPEQKHNSHLSTASTTSSSSINIPPILASLSLDLDDGPEEEGAANKSKCYKCGRILWKIFTSQLGLIVLLLCYSFAGAAMFKAIEGPNERQEIAGMEIERENLLEALYQLAQGLNESAQFEQNASLLLKDYEEKMTVMINHGISAGNDNIVWDYWGSLFFCATIFTTIGYGHITPATTWGRVATMIYAIIGIPLFLVIMGKFGKRLTSGLKWIWSYVRMCYYARCCRVMRSRMKNSAAVRCVRDKLTCRDPPPPEAEPPAANGDRPQSTSSVAADSRHSHVIEQVRRVASQAHLQSVDLTVCSTTSSPSQDLIRSVEEQDSIDDFQLEEDFKLPPTLAFAITTAYIFLGAFMYTRWEPWSYLEAFYFLFVSVSTIGFGDLIPKHPKYFLASSAYIVLGLALVAMMINVLIEFFNKTIDLAKEKVADVGRHMGLDVDEYESGGRSRASSFTAASSPRPSRGTLDRQSPTAESNTSKPDKAKEAPRRKKSKRRQPSEVDLATPASMHRSKASKETKKSPKRSSKGSTTSDDGALGVTNQCFTDGAGDKLPETASENTEGK